MKKEIMEQRHVHKYEVDSFDEVEDTVASEYPLTIMVNGEEFATMVCTPEHLEELVIGFMASEGLILFLNEVKSLQVDEDQGFAYVELTKQVQLNQEGHSKRFIGSCCGKSRQFYFQNDVRTAKTIRTDTTLSVQACMNLMSKMQETSSNFHMTGGLHNAALCTTDEIVVSYSDIGRHNALDKIYGYCLKNRISLRDKVIAFSGRISSEVLLKVSKIGVGIILSKSAPTTLALDLADDLGITTVGFIREHRLNVYTHHNRIQES
ncbi:formate dehydrogenase accessory sulfurtransferase FdhD [Pontibacillus sp. HMF3514]|uniref:formate dehydrogenase accessory sulfurtransferase FdhD n=1 Tax=Pontibacillus sp. HMF3514 TaxID=2692425 RepID=UPI001320333F|nr:formate dehydrogenase accessory sulfurtransferase FdhD [Pontibacillus sp. HMF3514]QHE54050.1 formate dehydrogenase accessory sulfurtransferase FdhD [Pontibacillus sp. HMF3514]